jgi:hypothetical protein
MPCNLPLVNVSANLLSKLILNDKQSLMLALYDLEQNDRNFTYETTAEGHIKIRNLAGEVTLQWSNGEYTISGGSNRSNVKQIMAPVFSAYQATVLQNTLIEQGYLTEKQQDQNNVVTVSAWRS